jgi:2-methylisocitrate lyase-like PEP mutase family enzyme
VPLARLEAAGVKRVSLGGALYRQAMGSLVSAARRLKAGEFDFATGAPTSAEITALLPREG